ncbi:hypothetical protein POKO110462_10745 [Pontibacter korlensis]
MHRYLLHLLLVFFVLQGCKSGEPAVTSSASFVEKMKEIRISARTDSKVFYESLPSASGLEYVQGAYYVLGDDTPYLYEVDEQFILVNRHAIFDTTAVVEGRIPKAVKPDLEGMAHFTYGRDQMLLLLGSGASNTRNKGYLINLSDNMQVQELDLSRFYTFLKEVLHLESEGQLNLEGLAMDDIYTYLLQRPLGAGSNTLLRFDTDDFKRFLMLEGEVPSVALYHFDLPVIGQSSASFSGAYSLEGKLYFTASVEDTPNAIDDGEVLGSFIGVIDLYSLPQAMDALNPYKASVTQLKDTDGSAYSGKAESLVVMKGEEPKSYKVIVVSDDDQGHSELLEVQMELDES